MQSKYPPLVSDTVSYCLFPVSTTTHACFILANNVSFMRVKSARIAILSRIIDSRNKRRQQQRKQKREAGQKQSYFRQLGSRQTRGHTRNFGSCQLQREDSKQRRKHPET